MLFTYKYRLLESQIQTRNSIAYKHYLFVYKQLHIFVSNYNFFLYQHSIYSNIFQLEFDFHMFVM